MSNLTEPQAKAHITKLLTAMSKGGGSDLFVSKDFPPSMKLQGTMRPLTAQKLTAEVTRRLAMSLMNERQRVEFAKDLECNFAISIPGVARFRVNVFMQQQHVGMVIRTIANQIPDFATLGLPESLKEIVMTKRGLILLVGATGSGKSTTLAAMINHRNENSSEHIVTIEDPIEFLHTNKRSIINQREVGLDTRSYDRALRGVMRAAPDVILIGEIRDRESMQASINLAGTGHLVLATLHANNCAETFDRVINMFPLDQHKQVTLDLSQYLRAVLAQRLVMGTDNKRVAAVEVMLNTPHIAELIKRGDVSGIQESIMQSGDKEVFSFDTSLHRLYQEGRISLDEALAHADSRTNLEAKINFG